MADDICKAIMIGRLTRDAETKYTAGGTAVCAFSMAVGTSAKVGDKWENKASYFDHILYGKLAETLGKSLLKGVQVSVVSRPKMESWEKEGQKHSKIRFTVENIQLLGSREKGEKLAPQPEGVSKHFDDDEIPF